VRGGGVGRRAAGGGRWEERGAQGIPGRGRTRELGRELLAGLLRGRLVGHAASVDHDGPDLLEQVAAGLPILKVLVLQDGAYVLHDGRIAAVAAQHVTHGGLDGIGIVGPRHRWPWRPAAHG
jgi:hypothetical protein